MDHSSPTIPPSHPSAQDDFDQTIKVNNPAVGAMYFNRYKLTRILGRGGMGVVWLADDLKLERPVALKFLPSLIGLDPTAVKELKTETRRGLELSHPNIVRIYDFVDDDDVAAISMEFVDGKTLAELRANTESGVFTAEQVAKWLPGVCEALDYAHFQRKVVHRDLKPANIMAITSDDTAKIADFGIARSISDTMQRLSVSQLGVSGTLPYMSPQQAMGERPTPADDVYSLGATIYELLAGKPPFYRGDIPSQLTSKVPSSMVERREELEIRASDSIPKEWEDVIAACLQKDPSLRPPSAGKLLELLGLRPATTSTGKTFFTPPSSVSPPVTPPAQARSRWPVYGAAAVAVLAAGAALYFRQAPVAPAPATAVPPLGAPTAPVAEAVSALPPSAPTAAVTPAVTEPAAPSPTTAAAAPPLVEVQGVPPAAPSVMQPPAPPPAAPVAAALLPAIPADTAGIPTSGQMTPNASPPAAAVTAVDTPPIPAVPPSVPASPSVTPMPPDAPQTASAGLPPAAMIQPPVSDPPDGHWPLAVLFPTVPHANYSESGRRRILYEAQGLLKEKELYNSTRDGKEGKGTHTAIVLFQAKSGLVPNGLLDGPTLTAMALADQPDDPEWKAPAVASSSGGTRKRSSTTKEEPNMLQRAGQSIGRLFKRD